MPGNEQYPGAKRRPGSKKGPTKGSGGQRRKGLEGKGPTPRAENRVGHPKARAKARAESRAAQPTRAKQLEKIKRRFDVPEGHEILCGRNAVAEAAYASVPITRVFMAVSSQSDERLGAVVRRAALLGAPVLETTKLDLDALTDSATHQGVAIEVPAYEYTTARDLLERARALGRTPLLVALDQVTDPHNLGAVLRSAGAFGADGVIIPERRSVGVNATVWKVSAGAAARVRVARETNLVRSLEQLKKEGCFVVGLDGSGSTVVEDLTLADSPLVLVTGAEGAGLSRLVRETCDVLASVPISRSVESLNAAVATGISLYEVDRLRRRRLTPAAQGRPSPDCAGQAGRSAGSDGSGRPGRKCARFTLPHDGPVADTMGRIRSTGGPHGPGRFAALEPHRRRAHRAGHDAGGGRRRLRRARGGRAPGVVPGHHPPAEPDPHDRRRGPGRGDAALARGRCARPERQ